MERDKARVYNETNLYQQENGKLRQGLGQAIAILDKDFKQQTQADLDQCVLVQQKITG